METKHTQGEWVVKSNPELCWVESKTHRIATVSFGNEANAKLIAAAPELLEALIEIVESMDLEMRFNQLDQYQKAKQAIKKATS